MTNEDPKHPFVIARNRIERKDNSLRFKDILNSAWALNHADDFKDSGWSKKTTVKHLPKKFRPEDEGRGFQFIRKIVFKTADSKVVTVERLECYDSIEGQLVTLDNCTQDEAEYVLAIFERNCLNEHWQGLAKKWSTREAA